VIALDVEPAMVEHMQQRIAENAIPSAEARVVEPDDPRLEAASVDRILIVDTWHHISDRVTYAQKLRDALRPGGSVLVIDFTLDAPRGPPAEMRLAPEAVAEELRQAGLSPAILEEQLSMQYAVRAVRE
jgi:cyclopropane fatty-acyl-phospholipid synthase-like methyltransferase